MPPFKCILLYFLLSSATISHAWWILDNSCRRYEEVLTKGMRDAFKLSEAGLDALNDIGAFYSKKDQSNPTSTEQAQLDLLGYLFSSAKPSDPDDRVFRQIRRTFGSILLFRDNPQGKSIPRPDDRTFLTDGGFVVYCDYSRFIENQNCRGEPKKGQACDTEVYRVIDMTEDYLSCKSSFNADTAEAWTVNNNGYNPKEPAQIQMCKWYLQKSSTWAFKYLENLDGAKAFLARVYEWNLAITGERTMMDAAGLIGHALLHELSHAIPEDSTSDIDQGNCYGWKNCRRLSDHGVVNADSYAHFGLGAKFINPADGTAPQRPMEDGSLKALPVSGGKRKRQYHRENYSNATRYSSGSTSAFSNNVHIPSLDMATLSSGNSASPRSLKSSPGSPNPSSSTRMPPVNTTDSTGPSTFVVSTKLDQNGTNSETGPRSLISTSNPTRSSSYSTLATWEDLLSPSPPRYNALKKTDPPETTDSPSSVKTYSRCTDIQTASFCVVSLSVSTPTDTSTASTKTVTTTCSAITGCSVTDTTTTKTSPQAGDKIPTATPIYEHFVWDGNTEWYYLQQLILEEMSAATWPVITWTAKSTKTSSSIQDVPTSQVDLGILTCGSPTKSPNETDPILQKRSDQGNPKFWMSIGKPGQSGLIDGVTTFCNYLATTMQIIDLSRAMASKRIEFSYNKHLYDPIYFKIEWRKADDCPALDFVNKKDEAVKICKSRLNTVIHSCDTSSNGHHWWKQGGNFFRDCLEWHVYRDTWDDDYPPIPTSYPYRPPKKCREIEDCDCPEDSKFMLCMDSAEYSDLGWCSCGYDNGGAGW